MSSFSKNLKYYRLKSGMTKRELAEKCRLTPMAISNYESGNRTPRYDLIDKIARALGARFVDLICTRDESLVFSYGECRKGESLGSSQEELVKASTEDYLDRLLTVASFLPGQVMRDGPACHALTLSGSAEEDAKALRRHLGFSLQGPVPCMICALETIGVPVYRCNDAPGFSSMSGEVNGRPFIVLCGSLSAEDSREAMAYELARMMFIWNDAMTSQAVESRAAAIAGAFMIGLDDLQLEAGVRRDRIGSDLLFTCRKYGISLNLLFMRMRSAGIIDASVEKSFRASHPGWTDRFSQVPEESGLLEQLVVRAVSQGEISIMKGAELLKDNYDGIVQRLRI